MTAPRERRGLRRQTHTHTAEKKFTIVSDNHRERNIETVKKEDILYTSDNKSNPVRKKEGEKDYHQKDKKREQQRECRSSVS